jgi:hypothetical protein
MGAITTITATTFPQQSSHVGRAVWVCFHYDTTQLVHGTMRRDDIEPPFETLLELDDGRLLRGVECQYTLKTREKERP